MELTTKALTHVSDTINLVDTYEIYAGVKKAIDECGVDEPTRKVILEKLQDRITKYVNKPVSECKEWLDIILKDLKK